MYMYTLNLICIYTHIITLLDKHKADRNLNSYIQIYNIPHYKQINTIYLYKKIYKQINSLQLLQKVCV